MRWKLDGLRLTDAGRAESGKFLPVSSICRVTDASASDESASSKSQVAVEVWRLLSTYALTFI